MGWIQRCIGVFDESSIRQGWLTTSRIEFDRWSVSPHKSSHEPLVQRRVTDEDTEAMCWLRRLEFELEFEFEFEFELMERLFRTITHIRMSHSRDRFRRYQTHIKRVLDC